MLVFAFLYSGVSWIFKYRSNNNREADRQPANYRNRFLGNESSKACLPADFTNLITDIENVARNI